MITIQLNEKGSRFLDISDESLTVIKKYGLLEGLAGTTGYVDETSLNKLRMTLRSLIASQGDDTKELLDLSIDVVYHDSMKPFGLKQLIEAYEAWVTSN